MQNVRSKSITQFSAARTVGVPQNAGWATPLPAGGPDGRGPQLRLVPGRIALFIAVLCVVAMLLLTRSMTAASSVSQPRSHVVERGETLWGVAREYGSGQDPREYVDRLLRINRLSSPQILPGQTLTLP